MPGPINTMEKGQNAILPAGDVCKTAAPPSPSPVPVPYPNIAQRKAAMPTQTTVLIKKMPVHTIKTKIPASNGDEAGASGGGGIKSNIVCGPCTYTMGSKSVMVKKAPVVSVGDATMQNNKNIPGVSVDPSQSTVLANS